MENLDNKWNRLGRHIDKYYLDKDIEDSVDNCQALLDAVDQQVRWWGCRGAPNNPRLSSLGKSGFHFRAGGVGQQSPRKLGVGVREKGSIDRTIDKSL